MHAVTQALATVPLAGLVRPAFAHELWPESARNWDFSLLVVIPLLVTGALYTAGLWRVWRKAGIGRGISGWSAVSFAAGWLTLAVALVSPVAWLSEILFSVHMTQHTLLLLVAAPLLTFGHPILAWMGALDGRARERVAHAGRNPRVRALWHAVTAPLAVFLLQAITLWVWHIPSWYQAALHHDSVHALEHLSYVLTGSLFWWAMVHGRYGRGGYGLAVLYVFLTGIHSGALGALLAVSPSIWYPDYAAQAQAWHVDALQDQQLAGLLMWIPAGVIFVVFGLALMAAWLGETERRVRFGVADSASRLLPVLLLAFCAAFAAACDSGKAAASEAEALTGGSAARGKSAIGKYGCGSSHTIPGIDGAQATVGPPLTSVAVRGYLAGHLPNSPDNMMKWIQHPQRIDPQVVMPEMGVTDQDARDITAYLYTLR